MSGRRYAVVAGGGTSGHVLPALAVARALANLGHDRSSIEFVGSRRGPEAKLLASEGFGLTLLPGRGIRRAMNPRALAANVGALFGLAWATGRALGALARWRPAVVVSVGGYASFPAGVAAVVLRRPLVLVNIDAVPGAVNRVLGRFASASAVAFPNTALPRAVVTGTPVRAEIAALGRSDSDKVRARKQLGLPEHRRTIAVFGGSLGARRINEAVVVLAQQWADRSDMSLYHVIGQRDWEGLGTAGSTPSPATDGLYYRAVPYEDSMATLYGAADLFICRAGAMTVAELVAAGVPAVLVPLPGAPGDHQSKNAQALVAAGAALLVPDAECTPERLAAVITELSTAGRLEEMGQRARSLGRPDAAARVAQVVSEHAR